ncbi:MAG TPA: molybdopterin dinucleotide binding domain-containing protein, partial [Acidothermaceae bacterium]|nr:molybdopterin dinucleotide binding domain-containing protein [Acidothermaceae bacterium]
AKLSGRLLAATPGAEARVLAALKSNKLDDAGGAPAGVDAESYRANFAAIVDALSKSGAVIMVGERLAGVPGALSAVAALADATGAKLAWVPRRAGERGALEAGAAPNLLPGGRLVSDAEAAAPVGLRWATTIPTEPGRDTAGIVAAATAGELAALVVGAVDPDDLPDPEAARAALQAAPFVVSLEIRPSAVTDYADVVFPVAAAIEKAGTFLDWEGRSRPFDASLRDTGQLTDYQVLNAIADEMDVHLGLPDLRTARAELAAFSSGYKGSAPAPVVAPASATTARAGDGTVVIASWHELLDGGSLQDGTPFLSATAKPVRAHLSPATARAVGVADGDQVAISTDRGSITLPVYVVDMVDDVVWIPTRTSGSEIHRTLGVAAGAVVRIAVAGGVG